MSTAQAAVLPAGFPAMSIAQAHQLLISTAGSPFELEERERENFSRLKRFMMNLQATHFVL